MFKHLSVLLELLKEDDPYLRLIRDAAIVKVVCIFSDDSVLGFGLSWMEGIFIDYRFRVWNEEGYGARSNYREFRNLVDTLE